MYALARIAPTRQTPPLLRVLFWVGAGALGLFGAYGPVVAGLICRRARRKRRPTDIRQQLLLSVLAAGMIPYLAFTAFGVSQVYFVQYGLVGAVLLAAFNICSLWRRGGTRGRRLALAIAAGTATGLIATALAFEVERARGLVVADSVLGLACAFFIIAVLARFTWRNRPAAALMIVLSLVGAGGIARAVAVAGPPILRARSDHAQYSDFGHGLTPSLFRALVWVREHTPADSGLAVNNYELYTIYGGRALFAPAYYYYSAFAERRVFLEGWLYSQRAFDLGETRVLFGRRIPFPGRVRLNARVFAMGDRSALCTLERQFGVRYLLVDRTRATATPLLVQLGQKVYGNRSVIVYRATGGCSTA
jgi:hypothetical protein